MGTCAVSESSSGEWKQFLKTPSDSEGSTTPEPNAVQQPAPADRPVQPQPPAANPAPAEGQHAAAPYPYPEDQVIGGDSVKAIQSRLLAKNPSPSFEEIERARIDAQDRFEMKVELIQRMSILDPDGDWEGRGARALDNPRTLTGEESLEKLFRLQDDLERGGVQSEAFRSLKAKVFRRP